MQIIFSYPSGRRVVGVVLAVGVDFIRILTSKHNREVDIFLRDEDWATQAGKPIRVDMIIPGDEARVSLKPRPSRRKSVKVAAVGASGFWI